MSPPGNNKIRSTFDDASLDITIRPPRRRYCKHPAPFSIRFTDEERAILNREAGKLSWAAYIRLKLFAEKPSIQQRMTRKRKAPQLDQALFGQLLGALGQSRLSSNLNQIAKAANIGTLPVTPALEDELQEACSAITDIRKILIDALGIKDQ